MASVLRYAGTLHRFQSLNIVNPHQTTTLRKCFLSHKGLWSPKSQGNEGLKSMRQFGCFQPINKCCTTQLRPKILHFLHRHFGRSNTFGRKRLPYEVDTNIAKDVTVFSYTDNRFYFLLSCFGVVQFIFWGNMASFAYSTLTTFNSEEGQQYFNKESTWAKMLTTLGNHKGRIAAVCMIIAFLVGSLTVIYPSRSIHKMVFMRGGREVQISTYGLFGRKGTMTVPLENISCKQTWHTPTPTLALQVKGKWFNYMMFKKDGRLHEQALFDYAIGLDRF